MKYTKMLFACLFFTSSLTLSAETYNVTGEQVAVENNRGSEQVFPGDSTPDFVGSWDIDTQSGAIKGNFDLGDFIVNTTVKVFGTLKATIDQKGINHVFAGKGKWDEQTKVFTYVVPEGGSNSSAASDASGERRCEGSSMVCNSLNSSTPEWEGLIIKVEFSDDMGSFVGQAKALERSGSGFTKSSTVQTFEFSGVKAS